ncbi:quinone-dependent dihydroorotate dehydrogenase [uncultured Sphingomonas sp.]|uniref:quinone-dependent dihydroorotate dehydrogenase n=1 Tax=uncultured Sphingomonas sp. TaxID=158754 RepID=UPI0035CBC931
MIYRAIRPALFLLDPERAHGVALRSLALRPARAAAPRPRLATKLGELSFANPIGIAAGLDKDGRAIDGLFGIGAGAVEIGTLTPLPQPGNPKPRMFRLVADGALINRLGFNNGGLEAGLARARSARRAGRPALKTGPALRTGVLGINVGANKDSADRIADYAYGVAAAAQVADYVTINISSPNTPGLRDLQHGDALRDLLAVCDGARMAGGRTPLWLKVAPDLDPAAIDAIARAAIAGGVDALVVGNTTVSRPAALRSAHAGQTGGLSGAPLGAAARATLAAFRDATGGRLPLVAVGGIGSAAEAYARIRAGASLVQLYTALVYEGPGLVARMLTGLDALLARDGFAGVAEAVGVDM